MILALVNYFFSHDSGMSVPYGKDRIIPRIGVKYLQMKMPLAVLLLLPISLCYAEPASPNTTLTFYIADDNLNTSHRGVDIISLAGLVDFTINGVPISGPDSMVETGVNTGVFQIQLTLPSTVNGRPLQDGDVVLMTYHQKADYSGNPQTITQSRVLSVIPANPISSSVQRVRIGHDFTLRLYAPNFNLDSYTPDDIPLSSVEFRMGGVGTTLADPAFKVNTFALRETGPNTDTFEATFKIPTKVDGFPVQIGSTLEFKFTDNSESSPSSSSVFVIVGSYGVSTSSGITQSNAVSEQSLIPTWVKKLTNYWCNSNISDNEMREAIKYLASNKSFILPSGEQTEISLVKTNLCLWTADKVSDSQATRSFANLVR